MSINFGSSNQAFLCLLNTLLYISHAHVQIKKRLIVSDALKQTYMCIVNEKPKLRYEKLYTLTMIRFFNCKNSILSRTSLSFGCCKAQLRPIQDIHVSIFYFDVVNFLLKHIIYQKSWNKTFAVHISCSNFYMLSHFIKQLNLLNTGLFSQPIS